MGFHQLLNVLLDEVNLRINNGQLSERKLALRIGVSQPHVHHVLSGKRGLTPAMADRLMEALSINLLYLLGRESQRHGSPDTPESPKVASKAETPMPVFVPILEGLLGPGFPRPRVVPRPQYLPVPREEIPEGCEAVVLRLGFDPSAEPIFLSGDLVVMAMFPLPEEIRAESDRLVAVVEQGDSWQLQFPRANAEHGAKKTSADAKPQAGSAGRANSSDNDVPGQRTRIAVGEKSISVGVITACIRRMRPMRFPLRYRLS